MRNYTSYVEDRGDFWRVVLINNKTEKPFEWVNVDKLEFPTKKEAIDYLEERYETEKNMTMKDISNANKKQMPMRMFSEFTDRKKKNQKTKLKIKNKRCRCK